MALVVRDSDTTTTDGTEQTLGAAQTFAGVYVVQVDLSALQAGESVKLKAKTKTLTGSAVAVFIDQTFTGVQTEPLTSPFSFTATLQRTVGTDRAYPWSINSV